MTVCIVLEQAVNSLQHQAREVPREIVEDGVANAGHVPASTPGHDDVATVHEMVTTATRKEHGWPSESRRASYLLKVPEWWPDTTGPW